MKEGFFPVVIGCSLSEIMLRDWNLILWGNRTLRNWHDDCELSDCLFFNELVTQYPCLQEPATGCCPVCSFYMVFFFSDKLHVQLLYGRICGPTKWYLCTYVCMHTVSGMSAVWETKSGTKDGAYCRIYCSVCIITGWFPKDNPLFLSYLQFISFSKELCTIVCFLINFS